MNNQFNFYILCDKNFSLDVERIYNELGFKINIEESTKDKIVFSANKSNSFFKITNTIYLSVKLLEKEKYIYSLDNNIEVYEKLRDKSIKTYFLGKVINFDFLNQILISSLGLKDEENES